MASRELVAADIPIRFYFNTEHGDWMQLDPTFVTSEDETVSDMVLSGYCLLSDSTKNSFSLAQTGNEYHIQNTLPSRTSIVDIFNYTDFETGSEMLAPGHHGLKAIGEMRRTIVGGDAHRDFHSRNPCHAAGCFTICANSR